MSDKIIIFDTTLRDGEQSPGCAMSLAQKKRMAKALAALGVDVIEAGFAAASPDDFKAVASIAQEVKGPTICALARCHDNDIREAGRALEGAEKKRIHVFIATSPLHREHKLKMSKAQVIERAVAGVRLARTFCDDVEFSCEDATRTEPDFLAQVVEAAIEAGATTINIPDTVGYTTPTEMFDCIRRLKTQVPNIDQAILSTHCHNDLGLAVANSLAAVEAGARQVECTLNGIGERAGNCALEEVVMAIKTRANHFGINTAIRTEQLLPSSRLLSAITGSVVPRNKAIIGDNAFAHASGIHQHGMLSHPETYEIMKPQSIGRVDTSLVLGKHSGRHALVDKITELGFDATAEDMDRIFADFKALADRKKHISDADIEALVVGQASTGPWQLAQMQVTSGTGDSIASAAVVLLGPDGSEYREAATGDGPVDAAFRAIERATGMEVHLEGLSVNSISEGIDAQGEAQVRVRFAGQAIHGRGISTDIVAASVSAFMDVINRISRQMAKAS
ncbi:2-isopropylmalate synthase [Gallaecimonas kandeliae]|uniref:2-isopropylmalate synthase n=1 Tax=Gallaecimonas kandeliae TaxID=3029055 RepID=UPI002647A3AD|nr:2-isopropylmalate synthase [Gallaecimonas kandeliae]WKE66675.1 2-isopropylmalate synthase [Gallaecimonas kandeliae]